MVVDKNKIYLIVMYCELSRKTDVNEIQRHILIFWLKFLVGLVRTEIDCYNLDQWLVHVLEFLCDFPQDMDITMYP